MAERKIFAGHAVRRLRRGVGLTQAAMADRLGVSPSYLNLVERNQRPLSAALMLRLADVFDVDPRALTADAPGGGAEAIRRRLTDPLFDGIDLDRSELEEWLAAAPAGAAAFARAYDALGTRSGAGGGSDPLDLVEREIGRWRGHHGDLDSAAENIADELRLQTPDLHTAILDRLRQRHGLGVRVLPGEVMPHLLARLDLHGRQLQLSESLAPSSRLMEVARQLALLEFGSIDPLVTGARFGDRIADGLYRRHLASYAAAAILMPYARFLRACEATGYDVPLLARRFGAGIEAVAQRLTSLGRVGARGLPFFMLRVDPAGQLSKRMAGASNALIVGAPGRCPLWRLHAVASRPGEAIAQLLELEDGSLWFTQSFGIERGHPRAGAVTARFGIGIGLDATLAGDLAAARGLALVTNAATPIGLGCRACTRLACPQRAAPPAGHPLRGERLERGLTPFGFAGD